MGGPRAGRFCGWPGPVPFIIHAISGRVMPRIIASFFRQSRKEAAKLPAVRSIESLDGVGEVAVVGHVPLVGIVSTSQSGIV